MNKNTYSIRLMVKCAQMYYEEDLNQGEIAGKLQISKSSVSRILASAREKEIVKIIVKNPMKDEYLKLEKDLEDKFKLKEVIIIDSMSNDPEEIKKGLGKAAAEYLQRVVKNGQLIGVTWGTTLSKIKDYVKNDKNKDVTFIPLVGGIGESNIDIQPNSIALDLSRKFKGHCKLLHAPSIVDDPFRRDMFIKDKNIQNFFQTMKKADISIMGIGSPFISSSTLMESGYITKEDIEELRKGGAIGDISSIFIDGYGNGDFFELNKRIIGINLDDLKKIPLKIGVAGHISKKRAILAAILGGYLDILITDSITAKEILNLQYYIK